MKDEQIYFRVFLRIPRYPAIVIAADDMWPAFDIEELGTTCLASEPIEHSNTIKVIDRNGEEFLYMPDQFALFPGLTRRI